MIGVAFAFVLAASVTMFIGLGRSVENFNLFQRMALRLNDQLEIENNDIQSKGFKLMFGENFYWLTIKKEF